MKRQLPLGRNDRIGLLRREMRRRECSHVLVCDPIDVEYLSGFRATNVSLLVSVSDQIVLTDFRYREAARRFCRGGRWRFVETREKIISSLKSLLPPGARVGIQSNRLTVDQFDELRRNTRGLRLVKLGDIISRISMVKVRREITAMARAARIGDRALQRFVRQLKVGMSEREAARQLEDFCRQEGAEGVSVPSIVLFGSRTALPHGLPSDRRLRSGDLILVDFGCTVDGFCSDMTRMLVVGRASQRQREIYAIVRSAQAAAVKRVRHGVACADVDAEARRRITQAGYAESFGHATGHGVGRRIHEPPRIAAKNGDILRRGNVITIEPGIYLPRWGGVRLEDLVLVMESGCRILTRSPRHLREVLV